MESQILIYLSQYGYIILFLVGVFGIAGIPVPEESLFVYLGILAKNDKIDFSTAWLSLSLGAFTGMLISYFLGRKIGKPLLERYGKYVGMNKGKWSKFVLHWDMKKSLFAGFFIPGIRQFNPYFAGMAKFPLIGFIIISVLGSLLWVWVYIFIGFVISSYIRIEPLYLTIGGACFFLIFVIHLLMKWKKSRR
ncbi:membrane protein DedA with SNARE-associated domain [Bacillus ectoiniformans]|uniref:DedA family protein n=1 Tax=Bacillus ectoiniformans TaxID=1494429 RepID=UPI00195AFE68|nr:DedA family protein [Bacillus ectoiniformans]MBM7649411.1 membrane protein DedA with SNARE-associated domain [Bacillus ectoiniformans]